MAKVTDLYRRVYKSECSIQDDLVSFTDYTKVHAKGIDMLATGKNKEVIAFFVRKEDTEMIAAFDNVGKLQMKINVLTDVVDKNNEILQKIREKYDSLQKEYAELTNKNKEYIDTINSLLKQYNREDEMIISEETEEESKDLDPELKDDDIDYILKKDE